uniref:Uncharacterized protein n=1 Tax=Oryza brachyantha TaxID=4533 RepID=J3MAI6_ORYBR
MAGKHQLRRYHIAGGRYLISSFLSLMLSPAYLLSSFGHNHQYTLVGEFHYCSALLPLFLRHYPNFHSFVISFSVFWTQTLSVSSPYKTRLSFALKFISSL